MLEDSTLCLCRPISHAHNSSPTPTAVPSRTLAPTLNAEGHNAMNPNLLPAASPASLLASSVLTTPTSPVKVPKPIVPDLGGGADVKAVAGPLGTGTTPTPPAAGAAGTAGVVIAVAGTAGVAVGTTGTAGVTGVTGVMGFVVGV